MNPKSCTSRWINKDGGGHHGGKQTMLPIDIGK